VGPSQFRYALGDCSHPLFVQLVYRDPSVASRQPVGFNLPKTLAAGNYLMRHEIIALHLGSEPGGAEFYVVCGQLKVGGNQSGAPAPSELVSFPGGYTDTDPGILDKAVSTPLAMCLRTRADSLLIDIRPWFTLHVPWSSARDSRRGFFFQLSTSCSCLELYRCSGFARWFTFTCYPGHWRRLHQDLQVWPEADGQTSHLPMVPLDVRITNESPSLS
jgi:hypothetical protein